MELIVGNARVVPAGLEWIDGGVIARLSGAGLRSVLDATFGGSAAVQVWAEGTTPRAMSVTEILMQDATTLVTLQESGSITLN